MVFNIGALNYALASLLFFTLCFLLLSRWRGRLNGVVFFLFCFSTAIWAAFAAYSAQFEYTVSFTVVALELVRDAVWAIFLIQIIRLLSDERSSAMAITISRIALGAPIVLLILLLYVKIAPQSSADLGFDLRIFGHVLIAIVGLSLLEQLFRSVKSEQRWAIKFLCFGLGAMYAFDFYLYSDSLLFKRMNLDLWDARGLVYAVAMVLIFIAVSRNPVTNSSISVSRTAIFYTTALVAAGIYLLVMSAGGYYLKVFGGDWGTVAAYAFLFSAALFLLILVFSGAIRARIRVFIDKHFLDYKYDYREQWLGLIRELSSAQTAQGLEQSALHAMTEIMDSPGGSLWVKRNSQEFAPVNWSGMSELEQITESTNGSLANFLEKWQWVINLDECKNEPDLYRDLELPEWLKTSDKVWLVVPLMLQAQLYGFVVILRSRAEKEFNWEDIDLLKTAGRQVAVHLAQERSALALVEARQFEAFNRFSAYVVHDLKNLVSQLALVVKNAEKHKHNPAFMDDAILTVDNAVERMNRLLAQLRAGTVSKEFNEKVELSNVLKAVAHEKSNTKPTPLIRSSQSGIFIMANESRLISVLGHIVQNAQDATSDNGEVTLELSVSDVVATIKISDTGTGMDKNFIEERLFTPFDTTKGLTGMGIGAHESRAFIEELGGTVDVISELGAGTTFSICLPIFHQ